MTLKLHRPIETRKEQWPMVNGHPCGWKLGHHKHQNATGRQNRPSSASLTYQLWHPTLARIKKRASPTKIGATVAAMETMTPPITFFYFFSFIITLVITLISNMMPVGDFILAKG
jgi:hypothetical protein